ncbi:MAG: hypothetical protein HY287_00885 [Planctomycetes bacterium]|nr:hypothetical protein [Planctomycetota bacterium]MBI3832863.1 hypothetical protein [Planctomycetota bacterium]
MERFDEFRSFLGFNESDAANLRALRPVASPLVPRIVSKFYEVVLGHSGSAGVFSGGAEQMNRLRVVFTQWLNELFNGVYDEHYFSSRIRIGHTHVRIGLPQHYMPLAIEVVGQHFRNELSSMADEFVRKGLTSLQKLLLLDLTIMLHSYKEAYSQEIRDLERRAMGGELERARHLAEIGELAASLAHEIKNPLAGISGAIQVIGESLPESNPCRQVVPEILAQINRLDDTVKDLLSYARPAPPNMHPVNVGGLVIRIFALLQQEPALSGFPMQYLGAEKDINADERLLEQLFMNLILNAAQASTTASPIDVELVENGRFVEIAVRDRGSGMSPEVQRKAIEPFFTTKAKGTGLGLAICRRIAEAHGGSISIESEPGLGTTVIVQLRVDLPELCVESAQ